jgi:hypothetical protein
MLVAEVKMAVCVVAHVDAKEVVELVVTTFF